jgi:hypothetical protein
MVELKSDMDDKVHCDVRIKITRTLGAFPPTVTIERLDENTHRHTLDRTHVEPADEDLYKAISIYGFVGNSVLMR